MKPNTAEARNRLTGKLRMRFHSRVRHLRPRLHSAPSTELHATEIFAVSSYLSCV